MARSARSRREFSSSGFCASPHRQDRQRATRSRRRRVWHACTVSASAERVALIRRWFTYWFTYCWRRPNTATQTHPGLTRPFCRGILCTALNLLCLLVSGNPYRSVKVFITKFLVTLSKSFVNNFGYCCGRFLMLQCYSNKTQICYQTHKTNKVHRSPQIRNRIICDDGPSSVYRRSRKRKEHPERGPSVEREAVTYRETRVYRHFIVVTRQAGNMQMERRSSFRLSVCQPRSSILFRRLLAFPYSARPGGQARPIIFTDPSAYHLHCSADPAIIVSSLSAVSLYSRDRTARTA